MYITCQKCSASFVVKSEQIGPQGRKVRCSKCRNMWHAKIPSTRKTLALDNPVEILKTTEAEIHLPILSPNMRRKKPSNALHLMAPIILAIILCCIYRGDELISLIKSTPRELSVSEVRSYRINASKMVVHYNIANHSNKALEVPHFRVRLYDEGHKLLETRHVSASKGSVEPNKTLTLKTPLRAVPETTHAIEISPWYWWDF
jgi:predicted Zn finger-like uncharacterized protein